jgi:dephospho-CoA kinase
MLIIGIYGKMGVGKDYLATKLSNHLTEHCTSNLIMSFADQLKVNAIMAYDKKFENVFITKTGEDRKFLQEYGEKQRNICGKSIWIDYLNTWIKIYKMRNIKVVIIPDVRYLNEIHYIKQKNGIIVKIDAPYRNYKKMMEENLGNEKDIEQISSHASENELNNIQDSTFDVIIDNNDLDTNILKVLKNEIFS